MGDRNYDSDEGRPIRRRLRYTYTSELYTKPSHYSKGDIREQVVYFYFKGNYRH